MNHCKSEVAIAQEFKATYPLRRGLNRLGWSSDSKETKKAGATSSGMLALLRQLGAARVTSVALLPIIALATFSVAAQTPCPINPPVNISSKVPADACIPDGSVENPFLYFDDFSWQSFVALVWPARGGRRGTPDPTRPVSDVSGPRVFETYKTLHELFHTGGAAPTPWNEYDPPKYNVCNEQMTFGELTLGSFSKYSNLGQADFGYLVGPLATQNKTWVRYETGFNESLFNQIFGRKLYLRENLRDGITFQSGSIDIKSAWIDMTHMNPQRYYTRMAWLQDPASGKCEKKKVGLVGLHIVQKTPTRPQWIWSTFEQVDNVPPRQPGATGFGFNDGTKAQMPQDNPYRLNDPLDHPNPKPFNVTRPVPVNPSTRDTNAKYQEALRGTPWQFYQLTMTQWPIARSQPDLSGTPENTIPGTNEPRPITAFANTTMETFQQSSIDTGCMNCHNETKKATDFLWSLYDHAHPYKVPNLLAADDPIRRLQNLLRAPRDSATTSADQKASEPMPSK